MAYEDRLTKARRAYTATERELRAAGRAHDAEIDAEIDAGRLPADRLHWPYDDGRRGREDAARVAFTAATRELNEVEAKN